MDADVEKLIDSIWNQSLEKISKKGVVTAVRSTLGDDIDICVPQMRAILLIQANPEIASVIYHSAYVSASRNSFAIMKKLGMPPDYFWKFEYWPKERAYDTLRRVINRVFTTMMSLNKEGQLDLTDVDVEKMRFTITVKECAECAGFRAEKGICYYHAGTLAGIVAALVNKELEGFETNCQVMNGQACIFLIGRKDDPEISEKVTDFLIPPTIITVLDERLAKCLEGESIRGQGNMVNIGYYQLMLTSILASDPEMLAASSFDVGVEHGKRLAAVIAEFFGSKELDVIKKYYNKVHQLDVQLEITGDGIDVIITECAEVAQSLKKKELLGFLFGELQGLVSTLLESNFAYQDSQFEGNNLRVKLIPQ
jgi:predicted hydrocarbon binding protein